MSVGTVNPFTPIPQGTVEVTAGVVSSSVVFQKADAVLIYNSGAVTAFVTFGTAGQTLVASVTTSMPIPAGAQILIGTPGAVGSGSNTITQLGAITAASTALLYITPGAGTQH